MEKPKYNWAGKTILVAEDEDMNFMLLQETFSKTGAEVIRAFSGVEVIEKFQSLPKTDLILMDVKMPKMNGYEAAVKIRKISDVPIIAQTAYALAGEEQKSRESGCNAYISKPIRIKEIMEIVNSFLIQTK